MMLFSITSVIAQPGKKASVKDKPPSQKEMDEMMKEMAKAMDEISPEDKKMLDSMGVKMPSVKQIPKFSEKQIADAWVKEGQTVPTKNAGKIAAIPATPTTAALPDFISEIHTAVIAKLTAAEKADAESVYQLIKQKPNIGLASAAIGFWIQSRPLLAIYLMGKASQEDPANIDNINNYAAMLSMAGAEQAALPVLQNLNKRFPNNSTVLNNLGQAWFGLGDIAKASRYLDSAILIYAWHSQANYTKYLIEENRGNTKAAIDALSRSIQKSHSVDKENKLKKLGKKLSGKDIDFPFPMPQDPLGLHRTTWPEYPMTVTQSEVLQESWNVFIKNAEAELTFLNKKSAQLEEAAAEASRQRVARILKASGTERSLGILPWYAHTASLKLKYLMDDKDGSLEYQLGKHQKAIADALESDAGWREALEIAEEKLRKKYGPLIGEGRPNPLAEYCDAINKVRNEYLLMTNSNFEMIQKGYMDHQRRWINNQVYYAQYMNWPEDFEVIKIQAKIKWLNIVKSQAMRFQDKGSICESNPAEQALQKTKLQAFDDVACNYHSSFDLGVMEFNNDCSRLEGKLKLGFLNYTRKINSDDHDKLLGASLEVKVSATRGWEKGPVQAEAKAEATAKLEWNDKEVTNWEVSAEAGVSVGSNLGHGDKSIEIGGVKAQTGMNSGSSLTGKGLLQNINITTK